MQEAFICEKAAGFFLLPELRKKHKKKCVWGHFSAVFEAEKREIEKRGTHLSLQCVFGGFGPLFPRIFGFLEKSLFYDVGRAPVGGERQRHKKRLGRKWGKIYRKWRKTCR